MAILNRHRRGQRGHTVWIQCRYDGALSGVLHSAGLGGVVTLTVDGDSRLRSHQQLDLNARKGRFGVVYMRGIASQAGCGFDETSPGEDTLAIDYTLSFPEAGVRVQVKTTKRYAVDGQEPELTYSVEDSWVQKWSRVQVPLYFVIVVVPASSEAWVAHEDAGTSLPGTAAYWVRLSPRQFESSKTIRVPRSQRVTAATMELWHADVLELFRPLSTGVSS
ncbi:DUF4365 domain-containing protein [Demequina silvatica]|uniref:DUF4365 domain-containing protein n=1 Tax=Demequina silvatica TaxID=1638988 RepID=UPI0012DFF86F|nr:DUF4365 domain-containing protein [Demequina silvatica]